MSKLQVIPYFKCPNCKAESELVLTKPDSLTPTFAKWRCKTCRGEYHFKFFKRAATDSLEYHFKILKPGDIVEEPKL